MQEYIAMREFVGERRGKNGESALFSNKRKHLNHRRLLPLSLLLSADFTEIH